MTNSNSLSLTLFLVALFAFSTAAGFSPDVSAQESEAESENAEDSEASEEVETDDQGRPIIAPSPEQIRLNEQAVAALSEYNAERAVILLEAAYELGPINIIALNLGRAYQRAGDCDRAHDLLQELPTLPVIEAPAPEMIENRASEYIAEIEEFCWTDEDDEAVAPAERENELIRPGHMEDAENPYKTYGYIGIGSGSALAVSSLVLYLTARSQRSLVTGSDSFDNGLNTEVTRSEALQIESRANLFDTIALGTAITGTILIGTGIYLLAADHDVAPSSSLALSWHPDFQGLSWSTSF